MKNYTHETSKRRQLALFAILGLALLLGLALTQVLTAAPVSNPVNQAENNPEDVITDTVHNTADEMIAGYLANHTLTEAELDALLAAGVDVIIVGRSLTDFSGSEKRVAQAAALPGATLNYTIVISNASGVGQTVMVTDTLPAELTFTGSLNLSGAAVTITSTTTISGFTWTGTVAANSEAQLGFTAVLTDNVAIGTIITNAAQIEANATIYDVMADTLIVSEPSTKTVYLPIILKPMPVISLQATRPNSANQWTLSWGAVPGATGYELQAAKTPNFADAEIFNLGAGVLSQTVNPAPGYDNVFYYRARAFAGTIYGPWSATVRVVGGFYDDFSNPNNPWDVRRTTYLEKIGAIHTDGRLLFRVDDRWDWGIVSPLKEAPALPYAIEYRAIIDHLANLTSLGAAFGGDWNGEPCIDRSSYAGVYYHENCFNHFYNTNTIWYGGMKVLFEKVDYLVWCPTCGGSPMKRLGNNYAEWQEIDITNRVNPNGYNTYRIEVRPESIRLFVNGNQYATSTATQWVQYPYFGLFSSADEYKPAEWYIDYYSVMPLD